MLGYSKFGVLKIRDQNVKILIYELALEQQAFPNINHRQAGGKAICEKHAPWLFWSCHVTQALPGIHNVICLFDTTTEGCLSGTVILFRSVAVLLTGIITKRKEMADTLC